MAIPTAELQSLSNKSIIELYSITLVSALHGSTDVTRFHSGVGMNSNANIIWQGNTYTKFPVIAEGFEYVGRGTLPRPTLTVSNVLGTITALMATVNATTPFNDLHGTPSSSTELPQEIYFIDKKTIETRDLVQFECVSALDLENIRAPKRQVTRKDFPSIGTFI
jgi:phage-related protein